MTPPTALTRLECALARIDRVDRPEIWIDLLPREALVAQARAIDARVSAGERLPLAGRTAAVKGNIDVTGLPTTAGHPAFGTVAERDAPAVARLRAAGALVLGTTNLDQFATGLVGSRSPYGAVRAAHDPERVSGGSSAGSAVAVALEIADIALGTDTAGSGRVPAALNGIVGVKATRGLVPTTGVVPASRSYDCVTVFARTLTEAADAMRIVVGPDPGDPLTRDWPADVRLAAPPHPRVGVPSDADLAPLDIERRALFDAAVRTLESRGVALVPVDLRPFLDAARLLYEGALVAERAASYGDFLTAHPEGADPTVARIAAGAAGRDAVDLVRDQEAVDRYRVQARAVLSDVDVMLVPTAPGHPTLAEVAAAPIAANSRLGTYTNFMNLLDLCGVAVPAGRAVDGLFGVTVVGPTFGDQVAMDVAALLTSEPGPRIVPAGHTLAVFGAHLAGQDLHHQLIDAGARFVSATATSPDYRMLLLDGAVPKPGIVRAAPGQGARLACELYELPPAGLGDFLAALPAPMALGRLTLEDGSPALGFLCSDPSGPDISDHGGWLGFLAARAEHAA